MLVAISTHWNEGSCSSRFHPANLQCQCQWLVCYAAAACLLPVVVVSSFLLAATFSQTYYISSSFPFLFVCCLSSPIPAIQSHLPTLTNLFALANKLRHGACRNCSRHRVSFLFTKYISYRSPENRGASMGRRLPANSSSTQRCPLASELDCF